MSQSSKNCQLCAKISGWTNSKQISESPKFAVFEEEIPRADNHYLVVAKNHSENIFEGNNLFEFIHDFALDLGFSENYRVVINIGKRAGFNSDHAHIHVLTGSLVAF